MSKWYEVKITNVTVAVIEVPDHENEIEAMDIASWDSPMQGDTQYEALPLPSDRIESCKRHADIVRTLERDDE